MEKSIFDKEYAKYYDLLNDKKDYSDESNFLEEVFNKYSQKKIKTIIDLGCGTGSHVERLSKKGYHITGIDLSKEMIKIANSKRIDNAQFFCRDLSKLNLKNKFDAGICMFATLGYLTSNEDLTSFFNSMKNHLNKDGLLILDCWNGLGVLRRLPAQRKRILKFKNQKIVRTSFPILDSVNHLCTVRFLMEKFYKNNPPEIYTEEHKIRFFFPQELKKYLEDSGFKILEICTPYKLNTPIDENSWNMIIISRLNGK